MTYAPQYYSNGPCPDPPTPDNTAGIDLEAAAGSPKAASADGVSMTAHSLPDLIAADKYAAAKQQGRNKYRGLRFARFVPPGTTSNNEDQR